MRTSIWKKENNAYVVVFHQASRMSEKTQLKETENMYAPIRLVRLDETYRRHLMEMMQEWREYNTTPGVNRSHLRPSAMMRQTLKDTSIIWSIMKQADQPLYAMAVSLKTWLSVMMEVLPNVTGSICFHDLKIYTGSIKTGIQYLSWIRKKNCLKRCL